MTLSVDERRALGIIAALLLLAGAARWLERPRPLLGDVPSLDLAGVEEASRSAREPPGRSSSPERPGRPRTGSRQLPGAAPDPPPARIDPNTATAAQLDRLPGVGPSLAARIVEERARGPFTSLEDLTRVRGIGAALATTLADLVTLPASSSGRDQAVKTALTPVQRAPVQAAENAAPERADLNDISSTDLQKVPGVGPVLAARLIARRDSLRRFTRWEQVDEVAGVGPAMLSRLREWLFITP